MKIKKRDTLIESHAWCGYLFGRVQKIQNVFLGYRFLIKLMRLSYPSLATLYMCHSFLCAHMYMQYFCSPFSFVCFYIINTDPSMVNLQFITQKSRNVKWIASKLCFWFECSISSRGRNFMFKDLFINRNACLIFFEIIEK